MPLARTTSSALGAVLVAAAIATPLKAADIGKWGGGSLKDSFGSVAFQPAASPCYVRADVGYAWSTDPDVSWQATNPIVTGAVTNVSIEDTWLAEAGVGCGSGSRGLRGDITVGYHGDRDITGNPALLGPSAVVANPLQTSVDSITVMVNGYYDLGSFAGFVPYLGAGLGVAWNRTDDVSISANPLLTSRIQGDTETSFAWALMAGVGYQISQRAILDIGYRYIDLGKATSAATNVSGSPIGPVRVDDLAAHEIKIGLRYHFGSGSSYAPEPLK